MRAGGRDAALYTVLDLQDRVTHPDDLPRDQADGFTVADPTATPADRPALPPDLPSASAAAPDAPEPVAGAQTAPAADAWPADGVLRQPDPRSVPLNQTVGWITTAFLSAGLMLGLLIFWLAAAPPRWASLLLVLGFVAAVAGLAWTSSRWPAIEHRHTFYVVNAHGLEIRRGVYWRSVINVPRSRVQHTDVSQGPLERSYGLGTLIVYTAGTNHAQVDLAGLDHATALAIRNHLLPRASDNAV